MDREEGHSLQGEMTFRGGDLCHLGEVIIKEGGPLKGSQGLHQILGKAPLLGECPKMPHNRKHVGHVVRWDISIGIVGRAILGLIAK